MPSVYKILSEFTSDETPESISTQPFWLFAVVRFAKQLTFSRAKMFSDSSQVSYDANSEELIKEKSILTVSDDVLQMQIQHSKSSYTSSFQATLAGGGPNYLQEIQPNDWLFAWIVNSNSKGEKLIQRVRNGEACNNFDDGLKFVGRVQSVRKRLTQSPDGKRSINYTVQAGGFKELDSSIYFDPALSKQEQSLGQILTELNVNLDDVFEDFTKTSGGLSTTKIIPRLLRLLIGEGIPPAAATFGDVQIATGGTSTKEAPYAYAVPKSVLSLLGQDTEKKAVPSFADVLELVIGLQKYSNGANSTTPTSIFSPDGAANQSTNHRVLNNRLLGTFQPLPISFTNKSVWSFLEEFKNPAVNEMYTALRVNPEGRVVPTIIVRQLPFSTSFAMERNTDIDADHLTAHLELPRWYCDPILVNSIDIGKSDAMRINFIHVYGQASADGGVDLTNQIIQNPPIRDEQDIKRSGLRPYMQTVACSIDDTLDWPKKWMNIAADFMIGQQYTLTGTCDMIGISAPICPGDCFEFDDTVYHIESVNHTCATQEGYRQFNTSVTLTHGMRTDTPKTDRTSEFEVDDQELEIYTGMKTRDNLGYDPKQTVSSRILGTKEVEVDIDKI